MSESKNYRKIKQYYDTKLWTKDMVKNTVGLKYGISKSEYAKIVNEEYTE